VSPAPEGRQGPGGRIAVEPELVREHVVAPLKSRTMGILEGNRPEALEEGWDDARRALAPEAGHDQDAERLARALAEAGYACREAELEMFEPARSEIPWLEDEIGARTEPGQDSAGASRRACVELALTEPEERPSPDSAAVSWQVPGPGAHVRHLVALEVADELTERLTPGRSDPPRGISRRRDVKRCFLYGFLVRCYEERSAG
jgi:hypothetical protein